MSFIKRRYAAITHNRRSSSSCTICYRYYYYSVYYYYLMPSFRTSISAYIIVYRVTLPPLLCDGHRWNVNALVCTYRARQAYRRLSAVVRVTTARSEGTLEVQRYFVILIPIPVRVCDRPSKIRRKQHLRANSRTRLSCFLLVDLLRSGSSEESFSVKRKSMLMNYLHKYVTCTRRITFAGISGFEKLQSTPSFRYLVAYSRGGTTLIHIYALWHFFL